MAWSKTSSAVLMHERHFGESGRGNGQFRLPRHICALPDGNLCISDTVNQRLQVITPEGEFVQSIGKAGSGPGDLRGPSGIACEGGHLYVVEGGNHRLQKLALADGMPVARAGTHGSKKNGELWCPHGVTISKGQAFVADYINGRIVVYDVSNMEHVRTFGSRGSEPGQLEYPCGIAIKGEEVTARTPICAPHSRHTQARHARAPHHTRAHSHMRVFPHGLRMRVTKRSRAASLAIMPPHVPAIAHRLALPWPLQSTCLVLSHGAAR